MLMEPMSWCLRRRRHSLALAFAAAWLVPVAAHAEELRIVAQTDKTQVDIGTAVTLTITIEGEAAKAELKPVEFPKPFVILAQQRASNVSIRAGQMSRSVSLIYLLAAQEAGTYALGPFQVVHDGKTYHTDPIEVIVSKPVLPPTTEPQPRYDL